ncbi:unnamed protein product [Symbiodinium sp. CCMP2592]|nr:unnamed protein product [Symbiodinium sp. CCMP2592]
MMSKFTSRGCRSAFAAPAMRFCSAVLILVNAIFVCWQTGFDRAFFYVTQISFFVVFFLDLVMRWLADGFLKCCGTCSTNRLHGGGHRDAVFLQDLRLEL